MVPTLVYRSLTLRVFFYNLPPKDSALPARDLQMKLCPMILCRTNTYTIQQQLAQQGKIQTQIAGKLAGKVSHCSPTLLEH